MLAPASWTFCPVGTIGATHPGRCHPCNRRPGIDHAARRRPRHPGAVVMSQTRRIALLASAFALCAAVPVRVQAQDDNMGPSRIFIEGFLAQYMLDIPDRDREAIGGVGVRAMLRRGDVTSTLDNFFQRAKAGVFLVYTADQKDVSTFHLGGQ